MNFTIDSAMTDLFLLANVTAAGLLGALIGLEREASEKAAGFRTHTIVAITSAMFVALANLWTEVDPMPGRILEIDPIRAIQAIAIGVGFLGSGIVFTSGSRPKGLTTAASVWATSAIGAACGFSRFVLAAGATILVLIALRVLRYFEPGLRRAKQENRTDVDQLE